MPTARRCIASLSPLQTPSAQNAEQNVPEKKKKKTQADLHRELETLLGNGDEKTKSKEVGIYGRVIKAAKEKLQVEKKKK